MKILFGGSFDPIHLGHLSIIRGVIERYHPEKFFLVPAGQNISKIQYIFLPEFRLKLIKKVLSDLSETITNCIEISHYELNQNRPVYTYETIEFLKPDTLLIGGDHDYTKWKKFHEVIEPSIKQFLVYPRNGYPENPRSQKEIILTLQSFDISSMEIINRLYSGQDIDHMVTPSVAKALKDYSLNGTIHNKTDKNFLSCGE